MATRILRRMLVGALGAALLVPLVSAPAHATQSATVDALQPTSVDAIQPDNVLQALQDVWTQRDAAARALADAEAALSTTGADDRTRRVRPDRLAELANAKRVVAAMESSVSTLDARATELKARLAGGSSAPARVAVSVDPQRGQIDEAMATIPYPVRTLAAPIVLGNHPQLGPAWGAYDRATNIVYVGADAFASSERLHYVVAHEFAHSLENTRFTAQTRDQAYAIVAAAGQGDPAELFADCMAKVWGSGAGAFYWDCPDAVGTQLARLIG
ncbi:MAG: hypothetical protein WDA60_12380 [Acidimicrobiia bacterium]|jgi:hypothetical protein